MINTQLPSSALNQGLTLLRTSNAERLYENVHSNLSFQLYAVEVFAVFWFSSASAVKVSIDEIYPDIYVMYVVGKGNHWKHCDKTKWCFIIIIVLYFHFNIWLLSIYNNIEESKKARFTLWVNKNDFFHDNQPGLVFQSSIFLYLYWCFQNSFVFLDISM